ncbi:hypothetical protein [Dechloromonas sp.]|uniref:hypothetical protein n=1 Tax=Dechloromonas sp. TaxID=1917218 RepID=UPI00286E06F0|nr:hypothetical protein [Dechloromonas sp.]
MLPCQSFPNVREISLREIWAESAGFNHYRGTGWIKLPCRRCKSRLSNNCRFASCNCQI